MDVLAVLRHCAIESLALIVVKLARNGQVYTATAVSATVWNVNSPPEWTPSYWTPASCNALTEPSTCSRLPCG